MMPLAMNEQDIGNLAHGIVVMLPLIGALVIVAVVSIYVVLFGNGAS